jgi:magnesium chelatase family protein
MIAKVLSCTLTGIDGCIVEVEVDILRGLPGFEIVGLPDISVKESRERVRSALKNCEIEFPMRRVIVNLAPGHVKKEGTLFDLPIAIGIMASTNQINIDKIKDYAFVGELSLDGSLNRLTGVLPLTIALRSSGIKKIMVPWDNCNEIAFVKDIEIYPVRDLKEVIGFFNNQITIEPVQNDIIEDSISSVINSVDLSEIKGQQAAKRALEVAAAGGHNIIFSGPPGAGKTMLAKSLPSILPNMTFEESLEVTKIYSVCGLVDNNKPLIVQRPFRSPHHTISSISLVGGGPRPKPGEVSLAHYGVLFLDELPEFKKTALEVLRQPLEDGKVTISRVKSTVSYPSQVMLVASMNPCPCGYLGDERNKCTCTINQIKNYKTKLSGPLLDRIDIQLILKPVEYQQIHTKVRTESSASVKQRVNAARLTQNHRYRDNNILFNGQLTPALIEEYCQVDEQCNKLLKNAFDKLSLSMRAYNKILKIARTIADLEQHDNINIQHLTEAIQYRGLDRQEKVI